MSKKQIDPKTADHINAQPRARDIQSYGTVNHALPLELEEPVRLEMTEQLNQLLADTMTLRDLYSATICNPRATSRGVRGGMDLWKQLKRFGCPPGIRTPIC
jgi:hypothetical protein